MRFFLDYHDIDKSAWNSSYGNMDFFENHTGDRKFIYQEVYMLLLRFNQTVNKHAWHFRWYFDIMYGKVSALKKNAFDA